MAAGHACLSEYQVPTPPVWLKTKRLLTTRDHFPVPSGGVRRAPEKDVMSTSKRRVSRNRQRIVRLFQRVYHLPYLVARSLLAEGAGVISIFAEDAYVAHLDVESELNDSETLLGLILAWTWASRTDRTLPAWPPEIASVHDLINFWADPGMDSPPPTVTFDVLTDNPQEQ